MTQKKEEGASRRDFLKIAGTTAPLAAVAVAAGTQGEASEPDPASDKMQDTVHTRAYFDSARF